jgi:hypothetical protein
MSSSDWAMKSADAFVVFVDVPLHVYEVAGVEGSKVGGQALPGDPVDAPGAVREFEHGVVTAAFFFLLGLTG